ncbi:MAG TPA: hypothetical protein VGW33_04285 [Terriglobia bacterium]|nr:hypothetical protein [Terriglobia bacterium]
MSEPLRAAAPGNGGAPASRPGWFRWSVAAGIVLISSASLHVFYSRGLTDLYGDALAHMEGARRLVDSLTPGYEEIGTAWLPLYHLVVAPLAIDDHLWRTGLAGSLVSTVAFAVAAWFVFRLGLEMNLNIEAGLAALAGFLLCANMLYTAATPLTEPLAMMWAILVAYCLFRFSQRGTALALVGAGFAAFFGVLTRYDGWFLLPFAALFVLLVPSGAWVVRLRRTILFSAIAGAAPVLWLAHNVHRFGNPIEFYNGPYSAQAIYAHQVATTGFRYPTDGSWLLSLRYYVEDCKLVMGVWLLELALLGLIAWVVTRGERRRRAAALLLLVPLPFYVQSMAHAAVPIYVPTLFPHAYYNLRYGLEMLPAAALFPSFLIGARLSAGARRGLLAVILAVVLGQNASAVQRGLDELPTVKESLLNTPCHTGTEQALIRFFGANYDGRLIVLALGKYPCVLPALGIPYHQTLSEVNRVYWRQLRLGPAGWPAGSPLDSIGWIIRGAADPVDELMRAYPDAFASFRKVEEYHFPDEEAVTVYRRESKP